MTDLRFIILLKLLKVPYVKESKLIKSAIKQIKIQKCMLEYNDNKKLFS